MLTFVTKALAFADLYATRKLSISQQERNARNEPT